MVSLRRAIFNKLFIILFFDYLKFVCVILIRLGQELFFFSNFVSNTLYYIIVVYSITLFDLLSVEKILTASILTIISLGWKIIRCAYKRI